MERCQLAPMSAECRFVTISVHADGVWGMFAVGCCHLCARVCVCVCVLIVGMYSLCVPCVYSVCWRRLHNATRNSTITSVKGTIDIANKIVCVCVCMLRIHTHIHLHICIPTHTYT